MTRSEIQTALTDTPISLDELVQRATGAAKTDWTDLAHKGRYEEATEKVLSLAAELHDLAGDGDIIETALTMLSLVEETGRLSETQEGEMADLIDWVDRYGWKVNFHRVFA